jgi:hypothetical protein
MIISETISRLTLGELVARLGSGGKAEEEGKVLELLDSMVRQIYSFDCPLKPLYHT